MKKLLFQIAICNLLLVPTVYAKSKTFKYLQKVKVISGFYEGCTGQVDDKGLDDSYLVTLTCKSGDQTATTMAHIEGKELVAE